MFIIDDFIGRWVFFENGFEFCCVFGLKNGDLVLYVYEKAEFVYFNI